jgi:hypothetical protein
MLTADLKLTLANVSRQTFLSDYQIVTTAQAEVC